MNERKNNETSTKYIDSFLCLHVIYFPIIQLELTKSKNNASYPACEYMDGQVSVRRLSQS